MRRHRACGLLQQLPTVVADDEALGQVHGQLPYLLEAFSFKGSSGELHEVVVQASNGLDSRDHLSITAYLGKVKIRRASNELVRSCRDDTERTVEGLRACILQAALGRDTSYLGAHLSANLVGQVSKRRLDLRMG